MNRAPRISTLLQSKLQNLDFHALTEGGTRPLSLHFGDIFSDTVNFWKRWLDDLGVPYHIAFALKATGQHEYITLCKEAGIGIDVASEQELARCIDEGLPSDHIIGNGPKSVGFISQAVKSGCLIAVNSWSELLRIQEILKENNMSNSVQVICRVQTSGSRFGIPYEFFYSNEFTEYNYDGVSIVGLSFHSDTTELREKEQSIQSLVRLQEHLTNGGHAIEYLNIGGGYRVKYCEDILLKQGPREYYQGGGVYGISFLDDLLYCEIDGQPFYEYCIESFTTLIIEPGRALLDQSGLLVHTIIDTSETQITIDGNIYSTGAIAQEMPHDPLLLSKTGEIYIPSDTEGAYHRTIYGNLCLESDRIYSRKIQFHRLPTVGDHLIFINTAGYFADFSNAIPIGHSDRKTLFM